MAGHTAARAALLATQRWTVATPVDAPLLRTDVYLCGDMVHQVGHGLFALTAPQRAELTLSHWSRLSDLETDWERLHRWSTHLAALQPYAMGLSITATATTVGQALVTNPFDTLAPWLVVFGLQLGGWLGAVALTGARWVFGWWLRRRMRAALDAMWIPALSRARTNRVPDDAPPGSPSI